MTSLGCERTGYHGMQLSRPAERLLEAPVWPRDKIAGRFAGRHIARMI
ncbi:MAG: hypothetical protein QF783_01850 [Arenicellales bacterium]|nr:hypothetical protein [Arenicellales bacterium]